MTESPIEECLNPEPHGPHDWELTLPPKMKGGSPQIKARSCPGRRPMTNYGHRPSSHHYIPGDPRYPDRPNTKDMERLSNVVWNLDGQADKNPRRLSAQETTGHRVRYNPFLHIIDPLTVAYMAKQRVALGLQHFADGKMPEGTDLKQVMEAMWMEAFAAGVEFQKAGGHQ